MGELKDLVGAYIEFNGKLCRVIGHNGAQFAYYLEEVEPRLCENCGHSQGKHQFDEIESSPNWREWAKPVKTLPTQPKPHKGKKEGK